MKWIKSAGAAFISGMTFFLVSGCATSQRDERIPAEIMWQLMTNPVPAVVISDNVPLYYDDPKYGRRVRDTLSIGERVVVWWSGEPLDSPQHVYSPRSYFGSVDGRHLKFNLTEEQLWARLKSSLETNVASPPVGDSDGPAFTVVSAVPGCRYFVAQDSQWHSLIEEQTCRRPREGDTGYGNLSNYGPVTLKLSGSSCSAWVDSYMMSRSSSLKRQAERCK